MFFDSHAHLFDEKIDLQHANLSDIERVLVPTYRMEHIEFVRQFCLKNRKFLLSIGVYPEFVTTFNKTQFLSFVNEFKNEIHAIGEIGLDSGYPNYELQKKVLSDQLHLAKEFNLPVSVHLRGDVFNDFWSLFDGVNVPCALHCFCGSKDDLAQALVRGCYVSFAANLTYKGNVNLRNLAAMVPDEKLLIETDSPSMAPSGFPRGTINTSENISYVAECLAKVRNTDVVHIANVTKENANKLFLRKNDESV